MQYMMRIYNNVIAKMYLQWVSSWVEWVFKPWKVNLFRTKKSNQETLPLESKVKLPTLVEGDPKAPFSIAATPR